MVVFQVDWQGSNTPAFNSPSMVSAIPASAAGECRYWFRQMGKTSCYLNSTLLPVHPFVRPSFQTVHPWPGHEDYMGVTPTG
ncbi:hypothetical protein GOODEAATRI_032475 [Goodea atripinnis]|uniref:Uncharacterized protein n=1 Tax=Goodea atripinnis TaxID=208336 RepID=A0ABV0P9H9_9TELE